MIDAGSGGICILANRSEQFVPTDAERERGMDCVLDHVAGRAPVIVTTTRFGAQVCAERSRRAQDAGAAPGTARKGSRCWRTSTPAPPGR